MQLSHAIRGPRPTDNSDYRRHKEFRQRGVRPSACLPGRAASTTHSAAHTAHSIPHTHRGGVAGRLKNQLSPRAALANARAEAELLAGRSRLVRKAQSSFGSHSIQCYRVGGLYIATLRVLPNHCPLISGPRTTSRPVRVRVYRARVACLSPPSRRAYQLGTCLQVHLVTRLGSFRNFVGS